MDRLREDGSQTHDERAEAESASPGRRTAVLQREAAGPAAPDASRAAALAGESSGGVALPDGLRTRFEGSLGTDLSDVRVHTGGEAPAAASARAFAMGSDIHFGAGEYQPGSASGDRLIAHEVAHTVQQRGGGGGAQFKLEVSQPGDALEIEADRAADAMVSGEAATVSAGATTIARVPGDGGGGGGGGGGGTPPGGGDDTWRGRGNLIGNPPVRSEEPPNKGIVEDAAVYNQRRAAAQATRAAQQARAETFRDPTTGKVSDNKFWFTKVYQFVTEGELEEAASSTFWYPSYVMQCVRYFDQIYADNLAAANRGGTVEEHWRRAFEVTSNTHANTWRTTLMRAGVGAGGVLATGGGGILGGLFGGVPGAIAGVLGGGALTQMMWDVMRATESLVASMQAHIRFDLPRAEAWVFNSYYASMQDARISNFQPDFMSMTPVFDRAAQRMNSVIASEIGLPVDLMPRMMQDFAMTHLLDANMENERADTWARTEGLVTEGLAGTDPYRDPGGGAALTGDTTTTAQPAGSGLANLSDPNLRPTMDSSAEQFDDDSVRERVGRGDFGRNLSDRSRMLRGLMAGSCGDDDENAILAILRHAVGLGEAATLIDAANAWDLGYAVDGSEFDQLRTIFRASYYRQTSQSMATTLICRCMDGHTAEWEEEMVADILVDRAGSDGRAIVTDIGRRYEGGGFDEGVDKIQWQLDGVDQDRFDAVYDP